MKFIHLKGDKLKTKGVGLNKQLKNLKKQLKISNNAKNSFYLKSRLKKLKKFPKRLNNQKINLFK